MNGARPVRRPGTDRFAAAVLMATAATFVGCVGAGRIGPVGSEEAGAGSTGLRALYRTTVQQGEESHSFRLILAAAPPDRLRLEIVGPLGSARLILAIDPDGAVGLFPHDGLFVRETDPGRVFEQLLGARIGVDDLIRAWTGNRFPFDPRPAEAAAPGLRWILDRHERSGLVRAATLVRDSQDGDGILVVTYPDRNARQRLPKRIELLVPRSGLRIVSRLQRGGWAAGPIPIDLFHPAIPASFRRADLAELGAEGPWIVPGG